MPPRYESRNFPRGPRGRSHRLGGRAGALAVAALAVALAAPAQAVDLRLSTENDYLTQDNRDDLYTFSVAVSAEKGPYTVAFRESAFTDRQAGRRFDETRLTVGRRVPGLGRWNVHAEAGIVHVGRGLLGQETQNAVHRLLGEEELDLHYLSSELHASLALEVERSVDLPGGLAFGPRFEVAGVPGFRSDAALGAQARWQAKPGLAVHVLTGVRWSDASLPLLDRHLASLAPIARVGVVLRERIFVSWSYNEYGDEREHLSVGVQAGSFR